MSDNVFAKKRRKVNLHSKKNKAIYATEREKAKPKSFSVFKKDLEVLDELTDHLEEETGRTVTKSFAMRIGIYYLSEMLKDNDGLTEEMEQVIQKCR